jgi:peroxiredoxin (alkyl hydroperoxide reductase subunit C)
MLGVGYKFPEFSLVATIGTERDKSFTMLSDTDFDGKWKVYFFWPKDFTFVCPTEIATFGKLNREFEDRDAQLLGGSTDSEYVHLAWRQNHEDLKDLPFPMLADIKRELCAALGILDPNEGVAQRATYIVDPQNVIRFVSVNDLSVGRNPNEVLLDEAAKKISPETIEAAKAAAAIMGMNNIFYCFQHLVEHEKYSTIPARLRMNVMRTHGADPIDFELWAIAVSAVNGCGKCIVGHERPLREKGIGEETITAIVRIASVIAAISAVFAIEPVAVPVATLG